MPYKVNHSILKMSKFCHRGFLRINYLNFNAFPE